MSARIAEAAALSLSSFRKRYRSSYKIPSSSSSSTLPIRKRYRGTYELILDTETEDKSSDSDVEREGHGLEDEGPSSEEEDEEEATPEGQQQLALGEGSVPSTFEVGQSSRSVLELEETWRISAFRQPTLVTWIDPKDGRVYTDTPTYVPPATPVQTPPSLEWSSRFLPVSPSSPVVPSTIASLVATLAATISVDEDQFLEVGAQLELHGSILHDHTQSLDALPPTLFEGYDRDLRELYTRSGASENHNLKRQIAEERRERLELTDRVARIKRR
ncbi:hypothetical protein Tco_0700825 [Tanacetum coccineum]